jgi:hypothetical protein
MVREASVRVTGTANQESLVKLGMHLREHQVLQINQTHLVIGEVMVADFPEYSLMAEGSLDLGRCGTVALSGLDTYHQPVVIKRMAYAKPGLPPTEITMAVGSPTKL